MRFEWDSDKDRANQAKHGLSFEEAAELFKRGVDYLEIDDEEHSDKEDRFIAVGPIKRGVIVVAYTQRQDDVLRIVSARMVTRRERRSFEGRKRGRDERRDS